MKAPTLNHSAIAHFVEFLRHKVPDVLWDFATLRGFRPNRHPGPSETRDQAIDRLARLDPECGAVACAVGLAPAAFPGVAPYSRDVAEVLGIPEDDGKTIFGMGPGWIYPGKNHGQVTRFDVADTLERYASEGRWW